MQSAKFDPDAKYIKRWLPELENISPKAIHELTFNPANYNYVAPVIDVKQSRADAIEKFKNFG